MENKYSVRNIVGYFIVSKVGILKYAIAFENEVK